MQMLKFILVLILWLNSFGCSAINTLYDDHEVFIDARNDEVGESIDKVLKSVHYYDYWDGNEHYYNYKKYKVVAIDEKHSEYEFERGKCAWALKVENESRVVVSWRFIGDRTKCEYKRFYEGPF